MLLTITLIDPSSHVLLPELTGVLVAQSLDPIDFAVFPGCPQTSQKEAELNAVNNGVAVVPDGENGNRSVAAAVADFLDETKLTKKPKTLAAYTTALSYFTESCHKLNLEDIDRRDLLKFHAFRRDTKNRLRAAAGTSLRPSCRS